MLFHVVDNIKQRPKLRSIDAKSRVIVHREGSLERLIAALNIQKCLINNLGDIRCLGVLHNVAPTAMLWEIENVVLGVALRHFCNNFAIFPDEHCMLTFESYTCIFEEDKTQYNMFVL